ncbi:MAG: RecQ family ATP-dependent DNA helicase, partial [Bacteroidota bacterium]|nr:RecQ family ATP-dependent DNA helicase [Bacteroidota bacterium]
GIQREIIESIGVGRDTLGLMPTGGGKSITFQVPALVQDGVCIVITPLIALMKDQVHHLRERGIIATAVYSGMSHAEIIKNLDNCALGPVKLLYVSPERLSSGLFQAKLKHIKVSFITVDEAHCISQWGYDFRPAYLKIADIRKLLPDVPVLALTATATPPVIDDIQVQLAFKTKNVFRMSFERKNLAYVVRESTDKNTELRHILSSVLGSAIVYVRSRRRCKEISNDLESHGLSSTFFHAGLEPSVKDERQKAWQTNQKRIIVATNAFGMGIDKPDVRLVIHIDTPDSMEAYFQEAGRAGRDGQKSYAVLLWNGSDQRKLHKRIADNFPEKNYVKDVYEHLAYYYQIALGTGAGHTFSFEIDKFCLNYKYFPIMVNAALKLLQNAGYLVYEVDPDAGARILFLVGRNELYRLYELTPTEESVITAVLRNYGGLFSDYGFVDEALIALESGLTREQSYQVLKTLSHKQIIHFIPQRKTPFITYMRDRVDAEDVVIPRNVYEERKEQFSLRIESVIGYATNDTVCRSRQLLRYFGDENSKDCGICDVCISHNGQQTSRQSVSNACDRILSLLVNHEQHAITELHALNLPHNILDDALEFLVNEEKIHVDGFFISIQ